MQLGCMAGERRTHLPVPLAHMRRLIEIVIPTGVLHVHRMPRRCAVHLLPLTMTMGLMDKAILMQLLLLLSLLLLLLMNLLLLT